MSTVATVEEPSHAEFLAPVLDHLDEGVYFVDPQRKITLWNRAAETITGWSAESVLSRRCADGILSHCHGNGNILCGSGCPLVAAMGDGDEVLRVAGATLRNNLRSLDVIARWGGEEFIVVAADLVGEQLQSFAERLRALLARCEIGRPAVDIRVTASIGCTTARDDEPWTAVTARADRLMNDTSGEATTASRKAER